MRNHLAKSSFGSLVIIATIALSSQLASAANSASDGAVNYTGGGWGTSPPNDGTGFGPWSVSVVNNNQPPYAGTYLDSSSAVTTGGNSFGTYANSAQGTTYPSVNFYRPFTVNPSGYQDPSGLGTLYNQTFSIALASDGVGDGNSGPPNSAFGFSLMTGQGAGATPVLTFEYVGTQANDNMVLIDNNGTDNTTVPVAFGNLHAGLEVSVAVGSNPDGVNPYTITVSPFAGGPALFTYSGDTTGPIQEADVFDSNTTGNGYFNDLAVSPEAVPEPATLSLIGLGVTGLLSFRRRK